MKQLSILVLLLTSMILASPVMALQVSSLQPATAVPGETVTLGGADWPEGLQLLVGETPVTTQTVSPTTLQFQVPALPPGEYAISVIPTEGSIRQPTGFILQLQAPAPIIEQVSPDQVPWCRVEGGLLTIDIHGRNFTPSAQVLLDGSAVPLKKRSQGNITLGLPQVAAGLHQLQVINLDGRKSLPAALTVDDQPQIDQLLISDTNEVVYYQIKVVGTNFKPQSKLLVNGTPVINRPGVLAEGDDRVIYQNCSTLHYLRYPLSGQTQELQFQIQNPDGQVSNTVSLSSN